MRLIVLLQNWLSLIQPAHSYKLCALSLSMWTCPEKVESDWLVMLPA